MSFFVRYEVFFFFILSVIYIVCYLLRTFEFVTISTPVSFFFSLSLHFLDRVDIEEHLLSLPPPITLWYKATDAVVQVWWLSFGITCIANLAYD
jgi:hypothetical protein